MPGYVACPKCSSEGAKKVGFTWWGGVLGPALFTHVRCGNCGTTYNGKTGGSNTGAIVGYCVVVFVVVLVIVVMLNV